MVILNEENIKCILCELKKKMEESIGVRIAVMQGSVNFENWLQVELCGILTGLFKDLEIKIEKEIDIVGDLKKRYLDVYSSQFAIQLKVLFTGSTSVTGCTLSAKIGRHDGDCGLIPDIQRLKNYSNEYTGERAVIFVVFPTKHNGDGWPNTQYRGLVESELGGALTHFKEFKIGNKDVVLYFAMVNV